jgi:exonuclease III
VVLHNVTGFTQPGNYADSGEVGAYMASHNVHFKGCVETNVNWRKFKVYSNVSKHVNKTLRGTKIQTSCSPIGYKGNWQPGGTATFIHPDWAPQASTLGADPSNDGRWSYVTVTGKDGKAVTIITAYRPCKNEGDATVWSQQWSLQRARGIEQPDPRKQFFQDLKAFITELRAKKHGLIVMMDANENIDDRGGQLAKFIAEADLLDTLSLRHPNEEEPITNKSSSKRIDYMLVSADLAPYVDRAGVEPFGVGKQSTHRQLFIDIRLSEYLHGGVAKAKNPKRRSLISSNLDHIVQYVEHLF